MKASNSAIPILLIIFISILYLSCKKDKDLVDENDNLLRKSFPVIDNLNALPFSKTEARVNFNISKVEPNDTIKEKWVIYYLDASNKDSIQVTPIQNNYQNLINLLPDKTYTYQIKVITCAKVNNTFYSVTDEFTTPVITLILEDDFVETKSELLVTGSAIIQDFKESDRPLITEVRFEWIDTDNLMKRITEVPLGDIDGNGAFKGAFRFFDYTKTYQVTASIKYKENDTPSNTLDFKTKTGGDFWVDMGVLPVVDRDGKVVPGEHPFSNVPGLLGLEGAVSFVDNKGMAYLGLGRKGTNPSMLSDKFYRYDPQLNKWFAMGPVFPGGGRMYAVAFTFNGEIYIGGGCQNCDGFDEYNGHDKLELIRDDLMYLNDFYKFDGIDNWVQVPSLPLGKGRFAAYGFQHQIQSFVGGGLVKNVKEGDIDIATNKPMQIDPGEWHDLNGDGMPTFYDSRPSGILLTQKKACDILFDQTKTQFCENCGCLDENCVSKTNVRFDIKVDPIDPQRFDVKLVDEYNPNKTFFNGSSGSFSKLQVPVLINGNLNKVWEDKNDNGRIEDDLDPSKDEILDFDSGTTPIDEILINNSSGIIWEQKNIAGAAVIKVDLVLGTLWCEKEEFSAQYGVGDGFVDYDELFIHVDTDTSNHAPIWIEWFDEDLNETLDEIENSYELIVSDELYEFDGNWSIATVSDDNMRYGAATFQNVSSIFLSGSNTTPFEIVSGNDNLCTITGGLADIGCTPFSNGNNFNSRVFPFSFEIGNDLYIGGGETESALGFDLWKYDGLQIKEVAGCGINRLTRAVGFSLEGKGFVGFGKIDDQPSKEFWTYIPKVD
nr:hypothetical protein [uncultured bacterium]